MLAYKAAFMVINKRIGIRNFRMINISRDFLCEGIDFSDKTDLIDIFLFDSVVALS